ncbi:MAG: VCBS repeat-containing protein [Planctomycetes bacterium]|nr:VCBS repeat-containing protein [Planctomycetota bacterium]
MSTSIAAPAVRGRRWALPLATALLGAVAASFAVWASWNSAPDASRLIEQAQTALDESDYARAERLASQIPDGTPQWRRGRLIAGEAAMREGRYQDAAHYFAAVPRDGSHDSVLAVYSLGEVQRELGRLSQALECYRYVLEHEPADASTHERLAFVLALTGQRWEARPHFMFLVRHRAWTLDSLVLLGDLERPMEEKEYVRRCVENVPNDVLVQLAAGYLAMAEGRPGEARRRLQQVVGRAPEILSAQAMLGELLLDSEERAFLDWHARLPGTADEHPDIWFVRGRWARRRGELDVAARCFWETVRRVPSHRRGHYELGQVLISLGDAERAEPFLQRSRRKFALTQALDDALRSRGQNEKALRRIAELMDELGRPWEAWAWATTAAHSFPQALWPRRLVSRVSPKLSEDTPQTLDSARLALRHDFSGFPDHRSLFADRRHRRSRLEADAVSATVRFEDQAEAVGLDFVYYNSPDPATKGVRIFEENGGGVAVLDFDRDGRPDLYFTQGAQWNTGDDRPTPSETYRDRLYHNTWRPLSHDSRQAENEASEPERQRQLGGAFRNVTRQARLGCRDYGQGVAAGDFDNDGFPDLYVANIGANRLYRNNGDGTFSDVTEGSGLLGDDWTASCVIADLDGDGIPDLYDVNYLEGEGVYQMICQGRACSPGVFTDARDRFFRGTGDGTFASIEGATPEAGGKGMGLVAARIGEQEALSLFIANDQVPNFFLRPRWVNGGSGEPDRLVLEDRAFVTGLAYDENGLPQACMGIAADDADGNGLIDFFVTNFSDEANTLYLQDAPELFLDATGPAGLVAPSLPYVGWGTQFLDADCNGRPDIVLVNGHVDDYRDEGGMYHMRPQFFDNAGEGRFVELHAEDIGDYFGRRFLGRGLARLDWNGDGRMDFVVSNIGDRACLVTNRSTGTGRFLNVRLHATASARDAIGTVVEAVAQERRWTKQLVAGDGYMASNERLLQFGLGDARAVDEVHVRWPSGRACVLHGVPVDATLHVVEGAQRAFAVVGTGDAREHRTLPAVSANDE